MSNKIKLTDNSEFELDLVYDGHPFSFKRDLMEPLDKYFARVADVLTRFTPPKNYAAKSTVIKGSTTVKSATIHKSPEK